MKAKSSNNVFSNFNLPYLAVILIAFISLPLFFFRGIGVFDDSVYLKIGELINQGQIPYRDVFDNKPPGIYYLAALIAFIGKSHWLASRVFLFVFAVINHICVIRCTQLIWGNRISLFMAIMYCPSYIICQGYSFHTEQFCAFLGILSVYCISGTKQYRRVNWIISGILIGTSIVFKQVGLTYLLSFIVWQILLVFRKNLTITQLVKNCFFLSIGCLLPILTVVIWLFSNNIWSDFYDCVVIGLTPFLERSNNILNTIILWAKVPSVFLLFPAISLIILSLIKKNNLNVISSLNSDWNILIFTLTIFSILPTLKTNSNPHYLGTSIIVASLTNSIILNSYYSQISERLTTYRHRIQSLFVITIGSLMILYLIAILLASITMIRENRIASDLNQIQAMRNILNQCLFPKDKILVLSDNAARLYYMSGRLPQTHYIYYYWNTKLSLLEASKLLTTSTVSAAITDLPSGNLNIFQIEAENNLLSKYTQVTLLNNLGNSETTILLNRQLNCKFNKR